jgi:uncharacterized protein (TIGR00369 family)
MSDEPGEESKRRATLERLNYAFGAFIPHNLALGISFVDYGPGVAWMKLPYDEKLVGNCETRVLHGGAISSLLDTTCGAAVFIKLAVPTRIATLDLRIDYLRPATPDRDVLCKADCYKLTKHVAFTRALAFHDDESDPIAAAAGSFVIFNNPRPRKPRPVSP